MKRILVFTATYNEINNISFFLKKIYFHNNFKFDLLIIDDNSPDRTWYYVNQYKKKNKKKIYLIKRKTKMGLDTAHKRAYNFALKNKYDFLITMDADLSHEPNEIKNFLKYLNKYAFVIGSRFIKNGGIEDTGLRFFLSYSANKLAKFLFKFNHNEFTTSYRGFNLKLLQNFNLNEIKSSGYTFFMETVFQILLKKYTVKEIPIFFRFRKKDVSKIPKLEILRSLFNMFRLMLKNFYYNMR